ncbi:F-box protein At5g07610-like [Papaver somniferum]|uniref:F-box protein At5g07610-like n=1 Tax=Papaver somniferum TaxID=3469 RepID=UPI000E702300|nr:F-box protein At5g07610-like [Papaver somniferum]
MCSTAHGMSIYQTSSSTETSSSVCSVIDKVISDIGLLTLILICLPSKSLLVLKSVSKQWLSIITDPIFAISHFRRQNPKTTGFFLNSSPVIADPYYDYSYDFLLLDGSKYEQGYLGEEKEVTASGGSLKSLVNSATIQSRTEIDAKIDDDIDVYKIDGHFDWGCVPQHIFTYKTYIYNPTTRQYRCLPPSPFRDNVPPERDNCFIKVCSISLAFDPLKSLDQHYQVICIWNVEPCCTKDWNAEVHGKYYFEIYSSKTNSWKKLDSPYSIKLNERPGVYWNGCLHWIGYQNSESSIYFDIKQEIVKPLPASPTDTVKFVQPLTVMYFGECGGNLYLIELESCEARFDILKMEIDYSGWKRIYRLDLDRLVALYPGNDPLEFIYLYRVVLFLKEDEAESLSKLVVSVSGDKLVSYDFKEMSATEIHTCHDRYFYLKPPVCGGIKGHVHHYVESLACV